MSLSIAAMQDLADELLGEGRFAPPAPPRGPSWSGTPRRRPGFTSRRPTLNEAWPRLGLSGVARLLASHGYGEWVHKGSRLEGPCPEKRGRCKEDRFGAYVYPRSDGGPPFVHCKHKSTCGQVSSVFDLIARCYP